jgi:hypothetical protein
VLEDVLLGFVGAFGAAQANSKRADHEIAQLKKGSAP